MKPVDWMDPQNPLNGVMLCFYVVVLSFVGIILCTMGPIARRSVMWAGALILIFVIAVELVMHA